MIICLAMSFKMWDNKPSKRRYQGETKMANFDAVEWFAKQGNTSYRDEIHAIECHYDEYRSEFSGDYLREVRDMMDKEIEKIRREAYDRFDDYNSDY